MKRIKRLLSLLLCLTMALALAACGGGDAAPEGEDKEPDSSTELSEEEAWKLEPAYGQTIQYAVNPGGCTAGPFMAGYLGYYEEAGLSVEKIQVSGSIAESVGTNTVQFSIDHIATELVPITNGINVRFVGGAHYGCKSLYVLADSGYETTADLVGKTISVPDGIGGADYNIASRFFDKDGINPLTDVKLTPVEAGSCVQAMQGGSLDGAILSDMFAYDLVQDGTLRRVRSLLDDDFGVEPCCVIIINSKFMDENPITSKKLIECVKKAHDYMRENSEETSQILIDEGICGGSLEKVNAFMSSLRFGLSDADTEAALKVIIDDYLRLGLITANISAEDALAKVWAPIQ